MQQQTKKSERSEFYFSIFEITWLPWENDVTTLSTRHYFVPHVSIPLQAVYSVLENSAFSALSLEMTRFLYRKIDHYYELKRVNGEMGHFTTVAVVRFSPSGRLYIINLTCMRVFQ